MAIKRTNLGGGRALPSPRPGSYFFPTSPGSAATSTMGIGTLRACPWNLETGLTITRIGAEVTVVGDVGSKVRLGIYSDDGTGYPGALLLDAGTINGDSATVQEITISQALTPGIYWMAGVTQIVTTTQPTLRATNAWTPPFHLSSTTLPASTLTALVAYSQTGVTAALPSTFSTTVSAASAAPRLILKAA